MIFRPELAAKVLAGEKTVTRRPVKPGKPCPYVPGRSRSVQIPQTESPGKGRGGKEIGRIEVVDVRRERVGDIFDAGPTEACREGFSTVARFVHYWTVLYGEWDSAVPVYRIEFRLVDGGQQ